MAGLAEVWRILPVRLSFADTCRKTGTGTLIVASLE